MKFIEEENFEVKLIVDKTRRKSFRDKDRLDKSRKSFRRNSLLKGCDKKEQEFECDMIDLHLFEKDHQFKP